LPRAPKQELFKVNLAALSVYFWEGDVLKSMGEICPACHADLPSLAEMRYCPYCGRVIAKNQAGGQDDGKPPLSLEEQQQAARDKYERLAQDPRVKAAAPEDIYTLALKGCENKEALIECLNQVLTRGEPAIRLAVSAMPSILLYKVNREAIGTVTAALRYVDAAYAVVEGTFDYSGFYKSAHFANLSSAGRAVLKGVPKTMWLGETIKFIGEDMVLEEKKGYGVFSDNALFFFHRENGLNSFILPVYQLDAIDTWEKDGRFFGEWLDNDGRAFRLEFTRWEDLSAVRDLSWD
jgi:hypothetical protein